MGIRPPATVSRSAASGRQVLCGGSRPDLEQMVVQLSEVDGPSALELANAHVRRVIRIAAEDKPSRLDAAEDGVELSVAHVKGIVMDFERPPVVEVEGQGRIH